MKPQPSLEELDILVARLHARLAARNTVLARWFKETMAVMEARFAAKLEDPRDLAGARSAALVFVKAALHQWATRPPLEHQAKAPSESVKPRKTGLLR